MNSTELLRQSNLKCTECRSGILNVLLKSDVALSEAKIKDELDDQFDRTTFYRSFKTLLEHSVLHKVTVDSESKYMVSTNNGSMPHDHFHFYCNRCGKIFCIDHSFTPQLTLPEGFSAQSTEIIVKGKCNECE